MLNDSESRFLYSFYILVLHYFIYFEFGYTCKQCFDNEAHACVKARPSRATDIGLLFHELGSVSYSYR
jgi:hypothetical protein